MAIQNIVPSILLTSLSPLGFYSTWDLSSRNGLIPTMEHIRDVGPWKLPGSDLPLVRWYTGTDPIDYQLTVLQLFFTNVVDGSSPRLSWFAFQFGGIYMAVMTVLLIEAFRNGNNWRMASLFTLWGLLFQNICYAVVIPFYCAIHLLTSPTSKDSKSVASISDYVVPRESLMAVPIAVTAGYIVPSVLMCLPIFSNETHQYLVAFWQAFPVWMIVAQYIGQGAMPLLMGSTVDATPKGRPSPQYRQTLRWTYIFAFVLSTLIHIATIASLLAPIIQEAVFGETTIKQPSFYEVFIPPRPDSTAHMTIFADGAHNFLQYDEYVGTAAVVIWAITLYMNACRREGISKDYISTFAKISGLMLFTGFGGTIVSLIWERDEMVLDGEDLKSKKKQ